MLISGQDDQIWPSTLFSEMIGERLEQYSYSCPYTHLDYAGAGHAINVPYLPTTITAFDHPISGEYLALGGNPMDSAFANADSWSKWTFINKLPIFPETVCAKCSGGK